MSRESKTVDILLVEDDRRYAEILTRTLEKGLYAMRIRRVCTESEFYQLLPAIRSTPPDIIILDMMIRWQNPTPEMRLPPDDVKKDGYYRAGLRCFAKLQETAETNKIPVIFHSVIEHSEVQHELGPLPAHVLCLSKSPTSSEQLINCIRSLVAYLPEASAARKGFMRRAISATEVKPEWLGISVDLKELLSE
jgi:CheY-like chemotaxis protein